MFTPQDTVSDELCSETIDLIDRVENIMFFCGNRSEGNVQRECGWFSNLILIHGLKVLSRNRQMSSSLSCF